MDYEPGGFVEEVAKDLAEKAKHAEKYKNYVHCSECTKATHIAKEYVPEHFHGINVTHVHAQRSLCERCLRSSRALIRDGKLPFGGKVGGCVHGIKDIDPHGCYNCKHSHNMQTVVSTYSKGWCETKTTQPLCQCKLNECSTEYYKPMYVCEKYEKII